MSVLLNSAFDFVFGAIHRRSLTQSLRHWAAPGRAKEPNRSKQINEWADLRMKRCYSTLYARFR